LTVELLDKLAKTIPVGVTLTNVRQQGNTLTLNGTSQSNARVSAYLKSLEGMDLFMLPELQFVRAAQEPPTPTETYEFSIRVRLDTNRKRDVESEYSSAEAG
jgi:type IV pilus assembly protein PilN